MCGTSRTRHQWYIRRQGAQRSPCYDIAMLTYEFVSKWIKASAVKRKCSIFFGMQTEWIDCLLRFRLHDDQFFNRAIDIINYSSIVIRYIPIRFIPRSDVYTNEEMAVKPAVKIKTISSKLWPLFTGAESKSICIVCNILYRTRTGLIRYLLRLHDDCYRWFIRKTTIRIILNGDRERAVQLKRTKSPIFFSRSTFLLFNVTQKYGLTIFLIHRFI